MWLVRNFCLNKQYNKDTPTPVLTSCKIVSTNIIMINSNLNSSWNTTNRIAISSFDTEMSPDNPISLTVQACLLPPEAVPQHCLHSLSPCLPPEIIFLFLSIHLSCSCDQPLNCSSKNEPAQLHSFHFVNQAHSVLLPPFHHKPLRQKISVGSHSSPVKAVNAEVASVMQHWHVS